MGKSTKRGVFAIRVTSIIVVIIGMFLISGRVKEIRSANKFKEQVPEVQQIFNNGKKDIELLRTGEFGATPMDYLSNSDYSGEMMLTVYVKDNESLIIDKNHYTLEEAVDADVLPEEEAQAIKRLTTGKSGLFFCLASEHYDFEPMHFEGCFYIDGGKAKIISGQRNTQREGPSYVYQLDDIYYVYRSKLEGETLC